MEEPDKTPKPEHASKSEHELGRFWLALNQLLKTILSVALIAFAIRSFFLQPFIVQGTSMEPLLTTDEYVLVDKVSYHFRPPRRGEVIIFKFPAELQLNYVKRIIGLPGETVRLEREHVYVSNRQHPSGIQIPEAYVSPNNPTIPSPTGQTVFVVPPDNYFVLGDNRQASSDSRAWGLVPQKDIIGRALFQASPLDKVGAIPVPDYP